jgi:hypothetical protein
VAIAPNSPDSSWIGGDRERFGQEKVRLKAGRSVVRSGAVAQPVGDFAEWVAGVLERVQQWRVPVGNDVDLHVRGRQSRHAGVQGALQARAQQADGLFRLQRHSTLRKEPVDSRQHVVAAR